MSDTHKTAGDFFIVDNSEEHWKALEYVKQWCQISESIDIATGYFEIGALLRLDGEWQKVDKIRILIGDANGRMTQDVIAKAHAVLDQSAASEIQEDPFLNGLSGIIEAIRTGRIEIKHFVKKKFHAKAYITHGRLDVVGSAALVGSSNFTPAGLTKNIELNVRFTGAEVRDLQEWFESYWDQGEEVQADVIQVLERYERAYTPFEVYAKALSTLTKDVEPGATEWERESSKIYPMLAPYQREAYHGLKQRAAKWRGAFLTDGVGLGKTFVGMMLAEYYAVKERKKVLILATKTGVDSVWLPELKEHLKHLIGAFASIEVMAHTDFSKADALDRAAELAERVDVIIIDEAHNFRNRGPRGDDPLVPKSRWWRLQEVARGKTVFNLTATPINNTLFDFVHQFEIFTGMAEDHFASLGIPNVRNHVQALEHAFEEGARNAQSNVITPLDVQDFQDLVKKSPLLKELIVQNSRDYAVKSAKAIGGAEVKFPETAMPKAVSYNYTLAFANLLDELETAFQRTNPLFILPMYYPLAFARHPDSNKKNQNRQAQVVALIRTTFLKRFESSIAAFAGSSLDLAKKIADWIIAYTLDRPEDRARIQEWVESTENLRADIHHLFRSGIDQEEFDFEDDSDPFEVEGEERLTDEEYKLDEMISAAFDDLAQLTSFLEHAVGVGHAHDDKILQLVALLTGKGAKGKDEKVFDKAFTTQKVLVFSEYADTARYVEQRLLEAGVTDIFRIDGSRTGSRNQIVRQFAPHYNKVTEAERAELLPLRVLISTDVLSEGVNLQDGTMIVNYDIHWNPVRLMQRIGRVDRRLNVDFEAAIVKEDPSTKATRGKIFIRNFLPPQTLNRLLSLYSKVQGRTVRISSTLGIPGGRLLDENDVLDDVKVFESFQAEYQGQITFDEQLRLHYLDLLQEHPGLSDLVDSMPNGAHSAKTGDPRGNFECTVEPVKTAATDDAESRWTLDEGRVRWTLTRPDGTVETELSKIDQAIRSDASTPRHAVSNQDAVKEQLFMQRRTQIQALYKAGLPLDADKPSYICWMEIQ